MKGYQKLENVCQNTDTRKTISTKKYGLKTIAATVATIYALSATPTPAHADGLFVRTKADKNEQRVEVGYKIQFGLGAPKEEKGLAEKINEAYAGKGLSTGAKVLIGTVLIAGVAYGIYAIVEHNQDKDDETPATPVEPPPGGGGGS